MEYSQGQAKTVYTTASGGILGSTNIATPKQPTIASAVGRLETLNGRLQAITAQLQAISDTVGGPRPTGTGCAEALATPGVVYRLNDSAEQAHCQAADIEELLNSISRALG